MNDTPDLFDDAALPEPTTIRPATSGDARALDRLADLEDTDLGDGPHLVAEEGGEIVAALSLADGSVVADPFRRTRDVVALLRLRASQRLGGRRAGGRAWATLRAVALPT